MAIILFCTLFHLLHLQAYAWNLVLHKVLHKDTISFNPHKQCNELKIIMCAYGQPPVTSAAIYLCFILLTLLHTNVHNNLSLNQHHSSIWSVLSMDALHQPCALVQAGPVLNQTATPTKTNINIIVLWTLTKSTYNFYFHLAMSPLPMTFSIPCLLLTPAASLWYFPPLTRGLAMSHEGWQGSWEHVFLYYMEYG